MAEQQRHEDGAFLVLIESLEEVQGLVDGRALSRRAHLYVLVVAVLAVVHAVAQVLQRYALARRAAERLRLRALVRDGFLLAFTGRLLRLAFRQR